MLDAILALPGTLRAEFSELEWGGARGRLSLAAALAVGLATVATLALRLDDPWWAAISAFICTQASVPRSLTKSLLRIAGTLAGAAVGYALVPLIAYDPVATLLVLFAAGAGSILGSLLSSHGYAWLLGGLTVVMVTLGALDNPEAALSIAFYRSAEIVVGVLAALAIALVVAEPVDGPPPAAPGWASLFESHWHVMRHAVRAGLVIAAVPVVWRILGLPSLAQMAISIGAIFAVPVLTGDARHDRAAVIGRAVQRIAGCALGGGLGLLLLALPLAGLFWAWLLLLMAGAAIGMQIQSGRHGLGNAATQATVALILMLVQGDGPPASLIPGVDRLAGMLGALAMMLVASLILGPAPVAYPLPPPAGPR